MLKLAHRTMRAGEARVGRCIYTLTVASRVPRNTCLPCSYPAWPTAGCGAVSSWGPWGLRTRLAGLVGYLTMNTQSTDSDRRLHGCAITHCVVREPQSTDSWAQPTIWAKLLEHSIPHARSVLDRPPCKLPSPLIQRPA